jgi:PA14 domain
MWAQTHSPEGGRANAGCLAALALCTVMLGMLAGARGFAAQAAPNAVANGNLTQGSGNAPASWKMTTWLRQNSTFDWRPGVVTIINRKPNDARWEQRVHLSAGWYHFTAELRARGVGARNTGAALTMMEYWIGSRELHGDTDWQRVGFYLKVGQKGADLDLACRLGGYAGLNVGSVSCRDIEGVRVAGPPPGAHHVFDLDALMARPVRSPASAASTSNTAVLFVVAIALLLIIFSRDFLQRSAKNAPSAGTKRSETVSPRESKLGAGAPTCAPVTSPVGVRGIEIALFVVAWLSFAYFYQAADQSTASRFDLIRALVEHHRLWINGYAGFNTADIIELHGHIYPAKAPGGALTGLVPWILVTGFLRLLMSPGAWFWALATYLTTVLSVSVAVALTAVVMYRCALLFGASAARAVALALTLSFATLMFPYATEFTGEPIAAACEFAAFYLLALPRGSEQWKRSLGAGLLAGGGVICDFSTLLLAVAVAGYALWKLRGWRRLAPFAAGATAVATLLLVHNAIAFGNPFFLSYEALMRGSNATRFPEQTVGFVGVTPHLSLSVLEKVLLKPQRGLFFCNPVLLLAFPGLLAFWRRPGLRAEFTLVASAIAIFILFNGSLVDSIRIWGGGTAAGPRHMVPVLPFLILAIAFIPDQLNWVFGALALGSAFLMLMATAVEPHLPYEYKNPFLHFLWPAFVRGDLAYNNSAYFGGGPIVGDSVAFNLGKLAGLPGATQLLPLALLWIGSAWYLIRRLRADTPAWKLRAMAAAAIVLLFLPPLAGGLARRPDRSAKHGLLGRYYRGMQPGVYPPHIQRIDRAIDFDDQNALGALPYPSSVVWTGRVYAPTPGQYQFFISADDNGWLSIDGKPVIPDPGAVTRPFARGTIELSQGWHSIFVGQRNIWGGESIHLTWQPPAGIRQSIPSADLAPPTAPRRSSVSPPRTRNSPASPG